MSNNTPSTVDAGKQDEINLPGNQCGAFRFRVEGVIFHGIIENAREEYKRANPSKKWYIWLSDNYNIIKQEDSNYHTDAFLWGTKYAKDKRIDFALLSTIVNRMYEFQRAENESLKEEINTAKNTTIELSLKLAVSNRLLHDLTPGGSEFYNDPERCAEWIRENRQSEKEALTKIVVGLKETVRELREALQKIDANSFHKNEWVGMAEIGEIAKEALK